MNSPSIDNELGQKFNKIDIDIYKYFTSIKKYSLSCS